MAAGDDRDGWVWMEFPETGGKQLLPPGAVQAWRVMGWRACDPPPEPDLLHDPIPEVDTHALGDVPDMPPAVDTSTIGDPTDNPSTDAPMGGTE